jgi:Mg2+-importing ATPase
MDETKFWQMNLKQVIDSLKSSEDGLSEKEANNRLETYGLNEVATAGRIWTQIFISQFKSPLILILIAASILSAVLGDIIDALVIIAIVGVNGILGFFQEYKSEKALEKLRKYILVHTKVIRDGEESEIDAKYLVPGDVVKLEIGDKIPADLRIIKTNELSVNESVLTGEPYPTNKTISVIEKEKPIPQELRNMAFMGTIITEGSGFGIVTTTGGSTELGKTASLLKQTEEEGEFQKKIRRFGNLLVKIILTAVTLIFLVNAFLAKGWIDSFIFAIALAVGIVPESLPIIITISLSHGALMLAKKKVVVKKLVSIEDLGNTDVICIDKTGTITENKITLEKFIDLNNKPSEQILTYGLLCNSATLEKGKVIGNPIDAAVWEYARSKSNLNKLNEYKLISDLPFDYVRKRMSVIVKKDKKYTMITKGAAEYIIDISSRVIINKKKVAISKYKKQIEEQFQNLANSGFRVLGVAIKDVTSKKITKNDEKNMTFIGFLVFVDPPKNGARKSIEHAEKLGIAIKILTGDEPIITLHVAKQVGLNLKEDDVITGNEIDDLENYKLREIVNQKTIFARLTPEHKHMIIKALKENGHTVAFLGDGVNDAPALKISDVGISVDTGAEVAKDASDIVLLQKGLDAIMNGVIEGRIIFSNIVKYIVNTISANFGNMGTLGLISPFMKFLPLLPSQILLNNFLTDTPMMAVSSDTVDEEELRKPRHWDIGHIARLSGLLGGISSIFDFVTIAALIYILNANAVLFRTGWFLESCLSEIMIVFAVRSHKFFLKSKRPSKILVLASIATAIVSILIIYTPIAQIFQFEQLPLWLLGTIGLILIAYFLMVEGFKLIYYKYWSKKIEYGNKIY